MIGKQSVQNALLTKTAQNPVLIKELQRCIELKVLGQQLGFKQKNTGVDVRKRRWQIQRKLTIRHRMVMGTGRDRALSRERQFQQRLEITHTKRVGI